MNNDSKHGESTSRYVCADCGSNLHTRYIITVEGEAKSICKSSSCVTEKDGYMSKGVVVDVREA